MVKPAAANVGWWLGSAASSAAFARALQDPDREQERLLRRFLKHNADTAFGREHGFSDICDYQQFARRIPPRDFDQMRPWIERIRRGEQQVLTAMPVRRLVPTGGSTAAGKLIPYTGEMQLELNGAISPWIFDLYRRQPLALLGSSYWSVTPVAGGLPEASQDSAIPIGFDDDADYLGGWRKRAVDAAMAVPAGLRSIRSFEAWRYVTLLLLLRRRDLSLISVWHPSFLDLLLRAMRENWPRLVLDVERGDCAFVRELPPSLAAAVRGRRDQRRAQELAHHGPDAPANLWPNLRVVSCWGDGHAAPAAASLAALLPGVLLQPKGLLATEGVVSIPYAGQHPLAIRSHFLEFEDQSSRLCGVSELQQGVTYDVLLTTGGGLCRYRLGDAIRVDGKVGRSPSIRFVGRCGMISDRVGEKLSEGFVAGVLAKLFTSQPIRPSFAMLAPDINARGCRYTLYVNADVPCDRAAKLDELLAANPQYAYCRRLGQLDLPRVFRLTAEPYPQYCARLVACGQRLGDVKPLALSPLDAWSNYLQGHYMNSAKVP